MLNFWISKGIPLKFQLAKSKKQDNQSQINYNFEKKYSRELIIFKTTID